MVHAPTLLDTGGMRGLLPARRRGIRPGSAAVLAVTVVLAATAPSTAVAADLELGLEAVSAYVFRGTVLNPEACLQPDVTFSLGALSLDAWASVNLTDEFGRAGEIGEVDIAIAYQREIGTVLVTAGTNHYHYSTPEAGHTTEFVADLVVPWTVELRIGLAWDIDAARGIYARAALARTLQLADRLTLDLEAGGAWADAGMNAYNFGVARAAPADGGASATLELETLGVTFWTRAAASWLWRGDLRRSAVELYGDASPWVVGLGLSASWHWLGE